MKKYVTLLIILFFTTGNGQNLVLEYSGDNAVDFHIYNSTDNFKYKIDDITKVDRSTVEGLVQSYFFAANNDWLKNNYLEEKSFSPNEEKHFSTLKKLNKEKSKVVFLHKLSYKLEGFEMCYINFIADLDGIDFKFPTLLSCIKKDNKWYIYNLANQQKITDILWTFRSCRILQLINGQKTNNPLMNNLIQKTLSTNNFLDINKLYDQTQTWSFDDVNQRFFTMTDNNNCDDNTVLDVSKNINFTSVFKSAKINTFDKDDQAKNISIISNIKKNPTDSIYLKAKFDIDYNGQNYSVIKYNLINSTGKSTIKTQLLDSTLDVSSKQISEVIFLFENLNLQIFGDLSPSMNAPESQKQDILYKNTRGNLDVLNISKLYDLYKNDKTLFAKYLEN